ncbi:hypothetical protein ACFQ08_11510 [Streptosporangium algeriense]|uniref:XRE family transcriptional regulator n=1 Tax=Streptosporangium algeriense TaxID=1682748 RepID=A0ABW3DQU2_9ACTN
MKTNRPNDGSGPWLASIVWNLLEERYGQGKVPSIRKLTQHIREKNGGAAISHGHIHNILSGEAANITDKTREILANFFELPPSYFVPTPRTLPPDGSPRLEEALAFRFASLRPEELAAIEKALHMVKERGAAGEPLDGKSTPNDPVGEK